MLAQSPSAPGWTRPQEMPLEQQGLTHYTPYLHLLKVPQHLLLSSELDAASTLQLCVCVCTIILAQYMQYIILYYC